tara:strand:+ start:10492 stop:11655 length:1164 start_codon:yes stop_codon:yes gene_type:complete
MTSTFVNDLRLNEMATGDQSGSWGTVTNTNLELIGEAFGYGTEAITTNADTHTTTIADGATDAGRSMFLKYTGTLDSACTITIGPNTVSKMWFIENATSGSQNIIISQGSGANVTIAAGQTKAVYSDGAGAGAAFVDAFAALNVAGVSPTELAILDGVTATTAEINILDGVTATTAEINILDGVTSTAAELNLVDGSTAGTIVNSKAVIYSSGGQVNGTSLAIAGTAVTSTAAELNILDGATVTTAELNYNDITTLGTSQASKAVTADANGVVTFDNGISEESTTITSSSNAATLNLRDGTNFLHDLTENVTYTFSNPAASGKVSSFTLKVIQDSTARTITWPSSVDWAAATAPTITATNNGVDIFVFFTNDSGTTYYGFTAGQAMA